jgi:stage V sporulation protein G
MPINKKGETSWKKWWKSARRFPTCLAAMRFPQKMPVIRRKKMLLAVKVTVFPPPEMNPKVQLELLSGEGRKKAIGAVVIYNAVTIRGISVVENSKKNPFVKMPRAPKGARTKHSDIAYPINRAAREMLYSAVLQEYDRLRSEEELRRQETKLQVS